MKILVINPGGTSTKIAAFEDDTCLQKATVEHQGKDLAQFPSIYDQYPVRVALILDWMKANGIALDSLSAVVGRGGMLKPVSGGTYSVNERMLADLKAAERGEHASNLGAVLAFNLAKLVKIPAFIVDPVAVDELQPEARVSGLPDLQRISMSHALNMRAVARKVAADIGKSFGEAKLIVAHLGTGVSMSAHRNGRMVDIVDGSEEGPFSGDRCGGLPTTQLVRLCYSGKYSYNELRKRTRGGGGFYAYLGTMDLRQIEKMAAGGDAQAALLLSAFSYQIAKSIGALATVLEGAVDRIVLTGGMAHSETIVGAISRRVRFIAPLAVVPGEQEMESLAAGALRVLRGEEKPLTYE